MKLVRLRLAILRLSGLATALLCACGANTPLFNAENHNVVLIVVDTLRADATDSSWTETPAIRSLAEDGVGFTKAFSHAPITLPSHASLFASRLPHEIGVLNNYVPVHSNVKLLSEFLKQHSYQTSAVVSLGTLNPRPQYNEIVLSRGFDQYDVDYLLLDPADRAFKRMQRRLDALDPERPFFFFAHFSDPHEPYNSHVQEQSHAAILLDGELIEEVSTSKMSQHRGELKLTQGRHTLEINSSESFTAKILDIARWDEDCSFTWEEGALRKSGKTVRLTIDVENGGSFEFRYWLSRQTSANELRSRYRGEVEFVDGWVGRLISELMKRGFYEDSLVIFTSDHGEALGEHGITGHVQNLHDEMLHVPLIIKLPRGLAGRNQLLREADRLVPLTDIVPTILEVIGLDPMAGQVGQSLLGVRSPLLVAETHRPESKHNYVCLRDEQYKLIYEPDAEEFTMFNLELDPAELVNVFATAGPLRPEWMHRLKSIAKIASGGVVSSAERKQQDQKDLQALGYGGSPEED